MVRPLMAALFLGLILFSSCAKDEEYLGLDLQPEGELLNVFITDTVTLLTHNVPGDSSQTSLPQATFLLGEINDPVFGQVKSSVYTAFRLSGLSPDFGTDFECDSLVLSLSYNFQDSIYGEPGQALTFSVKELMTALESDSSYYSTNGDDISLLPDELILAGAETLSPSQGQTVVGVDTLSNQLRVHLDPAYAESKFVVDAAETDLESTENFLEYFKGLNITVQLANAGDVGSISTFDANASATKMTMYYRSLNAENVIDTAEFDFFINIVSQRFLRFDLDPTAGLGMPLQLAFEDSTIGQQDLYIQGLTGANIMVNMPHIMNFADSNDVAINKAEIVLEVNPMNGQNEALFPFPNRIFGVFTNSSGVISSIPDIFEGETHSDGFYDQDDGEYRVNVTRFIQQVLTGEIENSALRLLPISNTGTPNYVQLYGAENPMGPARLEITYTKY